MMWWFPPAFLVAAGLLSLAWTAFLLFEITKAVELVVEAAASLSSRQQAKNRFGCGAPTVSRAWLAGSVSLRFDPFALTAEALVRRRFYGFSALINSRLLRVVYRAASLRLFG